MSERKDYVKFKTEICYTKDGKYSVIRKLIDKGKLSEKFLDDLWDNDSIDDMLLSQRDRKNKAVEKGNEFRGRCVLCLL